ncbi:hypothetical protein BURCENK562V_C0357 [Burkholderia cenocepacia K56-2Valvano]|nr:hypothetical protein BURCENK562V_C0357 [Burkholderia cenocepacia K56-2Valvano]
MLRRAHVAIETRVDQYRNPHVVPMCVIRYCAQPGRHVFSCAGQ